MNNQNPATKRRWRADIVVLWLIAIAAVIAVAGWQDGWYRVFTHHPTPIHRTAVSAPTVTASPTTLPQSVYNNLSCAGGDTSSCPTRPPTPTTTEPQITDQMTYVSDVTVQRYSDNGYNAVTVTATVSIMEDPVMSPGAGSVTFTDAHFSPICTAEVQLFESTASCSSSWTSDTIWSPVTASFSGTPFGYDDGHGSSYAGSSGSGF